MPTTPLVIGYYTPGAYAGEAVLLRVSLDAVGLKYDIREIEPIGTWQQATQRKARIAREAMDKHPRVPLLYIDVDAIVLTRPRLFDTLDCDVAASRFSGQELLSGTVFFGATDAARAVVDRWIALCDQYPVRLPDKREAWDQRTLDMAIRETPGARFVELSAAYTYIVGMSQQVYPDVAPVILHTRGSLRHNPKHV